MKNRSLFWLLFLSYAALSVLVGGLLILFGMLTARQALYEARQAELENATYMLPILSLNTSFQATQKSILLSDTQKISVLCKNLDFLEYPDVFLYGLEGKILCQKKGSTKRGENFSYLTEVLAAKENKIGFSRRKNSRNQYIIASSRLLFLSPGRQVILSIEAPLQTLPTIFGHIQGGLLIIVGGGGLLLLLGSLYLAHELSRPLVKMQEGARSIVRGQERVRLPEEGSQEMQNLARTLNEMTDNLRQRMYIIQNQQSELDAVFASMQEGVIAMDLDMQLKAINRSAARLLDLPGRDGLGRKLPEVARNTKLIETANRVLRGQVLVEADLILARGQKTLMVQVKGSPLRNQKGEIMGAVLVFSDVTRLHDLENVRREFVGNVSHELKTPIASITGAAETLLDGALDKREDAEKFIRMIQRNGERLSQIVQDLLSLSRLEQDPRHIMDHISLVALGEVAQKAMGVCQSLAETKNITLQLQQVEEFKIQAMASLLEQALVNLVDNAIKYSDENTSIFIHIFKNKQEICLEVADQGQGIHASHLPRLFERFYRVDKARSRKVGGTGLGLAIVKHICQIFHGYVTVKSEEGKGSCFTLHFPEP